MPEISKETLEVCQEALYEYLDHWSGYKACPRYYERYLDSEKALEEINKSLKGKG